MFDQEFVLKRAQEGFQAWRETSSAQRSQVLLQAAERLHEKKDAFAALLVSEAKKPITLARIEVARAIQTLKWAAHEALRFSEETARVDTIAGARTGMGIVRRFPRGVILGIVPFNFPLNLACHKIAPALATGNAIVVKPSPFTPRSTESIAELFRDLLPAGVLQFALPQDAQMPALVADSRWAMISFTGSDRVGRIIQKQNPFVPHCLELGGNAYGILAEDVAFTDFDRIAKRVTASAYGFAGQSCISLQNLVIHRKHWDGFMHVLRAQVGSLPFGDPAREETVCGPVINEVAAQRIHTTLSEADHLGFARVQSRSTIGNLPLNTVPPTLVELPEWKSLPLIQQEIFGPALFAFPFDDLNTLIAQIETSPYGLQASVFTQNLGTIETLYSRLSVGGLIVNDSPSLRIEHQPYGGVKASGEGREGLRYAMNEMTVTKFLSLSSSIPG